MQQEFVDYIKLESSELISSFKKASILGKGTPQETADYRENSFKAFVGRYFPFPHRITKGKIRDSYGSTSASIDCLIINPNHPYTIDSENKFSMIFADGVDLVVEVKPDISSVSELQRGLTQIQSVKKLLRRNGPILLKDGMPPDYLDYNKRIPSFIFSMKAKSNIEDTCQDVINFYASSSIPKNEQVDFIVVNDIGIISNYKCEQMSIAIDIPTGKKLTGWFFEEWGDLTLPAFVLRMNNVPHASATIHKNFLNYYFDGLMPYSIRKL